MAEIVGIREALDGRSGKPNASVIALLKEMLADAESGHIQHVCVVAIDQNGVTCDAYAPGGEIADITNMLGALELCKSQLAYSVVKQQGY